MVSVKGGEPDPKLLLNTHSIGGDFPLSSVAELWCSQEAQEALGASAFQPLGSVAGDPQAPQRTPENLLSPIEYCVID